MSISPSCVQWHDVRRKCLIHSKVEFGSKDNNSESRRMVILKNKKNDKPARVKYLVIFLPDLYWKANTES